MHLASSTSNISSSTAYRKEINKKDLIKEAQRVGEALKEKLDSAALECKNGSKDLHATALNYGPYKLSYNNIMAKALDFDVLISTYANTYLALGLSTAMLGLFIQEVDKELKVSLEEDVAGRMRKIIKESQKVRADQLSFVKDLKENIIPSLVNWNRKEEEFFLRAEREKEMSCLESEEGRGDDLNPCVTTKTQKRESKISNILSEPADSETKEILDLLFNLSQYTLAYASAPIKLPLRGSRCSSTEKNFLVLEESWRGQKKDSNDLEPFYMADLKETMRLTCDLISVISLNYLTELSDISAENRHNEAIEAHDEIVLQDSPLLNLQDASAEEVSTKQIRVL